MVVQIQPYFQLALNVCNLIIILFGFYKFMGKPHSNLETRVTALEIKVKEHDESLKQGKDNFRAQKKTDALIINSLIALIEFEVDYCMHHGDEQISPRLETVKNKLYEFLSEK